MKKIAIIIVVLTVIGCNNSQSKDNAELNEFISALDNKSLEEIKEEVNANVKQFDAFIKFFEGSFSNEIENIEKEDEKYEPEFKVDTMGIAKALHQFNNIVFGQTYENYQSQLEFAKNNANSSRLLKLGQGVSQKFIPTKIYYNNGDVRTDSIANYEVDFSFDSEWGQVKPIDSIDITYEVNYVTDYDVVEVSVNNPTVSYKGGEIKLVKAQDNYAYLTFSDTIAEPTKTQGYTIENKILNGSGSSNNNVAPSDSKNVMSEMLGYFKKLQKKLNDDDFENTAEFQEYLKNNLANLDFFNDKDGLFHREYYYYGNVNSLKIYFKNDSKSHKVSFTARNNTPFNQSDDLFPMETEDAIIFINNNGESEITIKGTDNDINVEAFNNGLVGIQSEQENDEFSLFTFNYKPANNKKYWTLREIGNVLFGIRNDKYYILDEKGKETLVTGVTKIYDELSNDRIMASNQNKIGFINSKGKIVTPFKYNDAKNYEDGITAVKFDGTYKLIDINGKVLVDTKEDDIDFLKKDDQEKRIYSFDYGKKRYNYKGELIENN